MKLDYGTQISPVPIMLSIGSIRKPTLREISEITFDKFMFYETLMKLTPQFYYEKMCGEQEKSKWLSLSDKDKSRLELFDIIRGNTQLAELYAEMLDYFFVESIIYKEGYFIILKPGVEDSGELKAEDIKNAISEKTFQEILELLQQICGIYEGAVEEQKFKNNLAKALFEKMLKGKKKEKKVDKNLSLPNIISSVCSKHPSLNYTNIWGLTMFQLIDTFNRIQMNTVYDIESTRVSVWGDEKKTFDASLWYKNNFDTR
jgi:uncharacterized protein YktA (UPF0223 family)